MSAEDLTEMQQAAVMMNEMFVACTQAGFTEDQAIKILIGMMGNASGHLMPPPPSSNGRAN